MSKTVVFSWTGAAMLAGAILLTGAMPGEAATACRAGVYRAGCVHTAPVVRHPPAAAAGCRYVNGRRVCGVVR